MDIWFVFAFAILGFACLGVFIGWLAHRKASEVESRIASLERELREAKLKWPAAPPPLAPEPAQPDTQKQPQIRVEFPLPPPIAAPPPPPPPLVLEVSAAKASEQSTHTQDWSSRAERVSEHGPAKPEVEKPAFNLERWLGVRGAAVLGGVFMIFAGFLFLQHSIERGWVTPAVRLIVGATFGVACLAVAGRLRPRKYDVLANSLTGAGVVLLYAVAWAAHVLYGRIEFLSAFAIMVGVTVLCGWLAYRHSSQLIAVLGLVGGFATPLALSTGQDRPLGLFGYALLLDLGFLFVSHKRRWPNIALVGLIGTTLLQGLWIFWRMGPERLPLALGVLCVFGIVFAVFTALQPRESRAQWIPTQAGALLLPFAFVVYFAQQIQLGSHLAPLAAIAIVMSIGAGVLSRLQGTPWLSLGTSAGSLALVLVWVGVKVPDLEAARAWELVFCSLALALVQHGFAEFEARRAADPKPVVQAATTLTLGLGVACALAAAICPRVPLWPWVLASALLPLFHLRQSVLDSRALLASVSSFVAGAGLAAWTLNHEGGVLAPAPTLFFATLLGLGALQLAACSLRRTADRTKSFAAVAAFFLPALLAAGHGEPRLIAPTGLELAATFALGLMMGAAATGARSSVLFGLAILAAAAAQVHGASVDVAACAQSPEWLRVLLIAALGVAAFSAWPFQTAAVFRDRPGMWRAAALSSLVWFGLIQALVVARLGAGLRFAAPLGFALFVGLLAWRLWSSGEAERDERERIDKHASAERAAEIRTRHVARACFTAAALFFASFSVPLQVDRDPFALGMAIFGLALAAAWTRIDSRMLKYLAVAALVLAMWNLVGDRWFGTFPRARWRLFNPQAYLFLLPALCAALAAWLLRAREVARARGFELQHFQGARPLCAIVASICAVLFAFAWINLEVADAFSETENFSMRLRGTPRANLAMSIAWALYALFLLGAGVMKSLGGMRWASLILFLMTIAKVFLFDLGHLGGLYRVASMLGLALSLLVVSFLYQRFVFRRRTVAGEAA